MILGLTKEVYDKFGFSNYTARISVRDPKNPDKYFGDNELWNRAEKTLVEGIKRWGSEYFIGEGEAAFYGPKIDLMVEDALGRQWQLTTVQLDFTQPENFDLTYAGEDGKEHRPAVLHVAIFGSLERFMGIVIEHFGGAFPAWLAPVTARVIPVSGDFSDYAGKVVADLRRAGVRVEFDDSNDSLSKKIRNAEKMKIPFMLVVGEKEVSGGTVAVRDYATKEQKVMGVDELVQLCK
jgi:threonyl-tRNA synthetase